MDENMNMQIILEAVDQSQDAFKGIDDALNQIIGIADNLTNTFTGFIEEASKIDGINTSGFENELTRIQEDVSKVQESVSKLSDETIKINVSDAADALKTITKDADEATKAVENIGKGGVSGGGMKEEEPKGLANMGTQNDLMYGGMTMTAGALPIVAAFKDAIKTFGDFDQAVANVNTMMGDTPAQVDAIKQQLIELSKTVPDGPVALANALYGIVGAGVPANDAMGVLATASKAAAAGQTDVSTATSALIAVMDSYGLSAKDVNTISDQMFAANAAGAMTFTDFAKAVGTVAGPAAQVGVSFDQVAGATAALTNEGLSAQRATMGLRALLMGIAAPTAGATAEAHKLGIEWDAATLKQKGLSGMMQEAMKATGGNTEELKKLIPNIAAWTVATDLGGKGAEAYKQAMDTMSQSSGATDKAMKAQEQGFTEGVDHMKAAIQSAQIVFVQNFAPAITKVVQGITSLVQWFGNLSPNTQKFIGLMAAGAAALMLFVGGAMLIGSAIGNMITGFSALAKAFEAVSVAEGIMDALNPVGWIILAVAAVIALAAAIIAYWNPIKTFVSKLWTDIETVTQTVWKAVVTWLSGVWNGIVTTVTGVWNSILTTTSTIWNAIINGIQTVWNGFVSWITASVMAPFTIIVAAFQWLYNHNYYFKELVDFIQKQWQQIKKDASDIWNGIKQFFANIWNDIKKAAESYWNTEMQFYKTIWNAIVQVANTVWTPIKDFFSGIWNDISTVASTVWGSIQKTMSGLWNGIVTDAENIFNGLGKWFEGLWQQAEQWGANLIHMVAQGIANAAHEVEDAVKNVAGKVASFLGFHSPTKEGPGSDADTWAPNFVKMFAGGIANGANRIAQAANTMISPLGASVNGTMSHSIVTGGVGGNGQIVFAPTIHVSGNVTRNEQELAKIVSRELYKQAKSLGKF